MDSPPHHGRPRTVREGRPGDLPAAAPLHPQPQRAPAIRALVPAQRGARGSQTHEKGITRAATGACGSRTAFRPTGIQSEFTRMSIEAAETERELQRVLEKLSPRQRLVIVQRYYTEDCPKGWATALPVARAWNQCDNRPLALLANTTSTGAAWKSNPSVAART